MKELSEELLREVIAYGEIIGEGTTRAVYKYEGRIFKIAFEDSKEENKNEAITYDVYGQQFDFLNKVLGFTEDYSMIEVEELDCIALEEKFVEVVESERDASEVFIQELIELAGLEHCVDFSFESLEELIHGIELDPAEVLLCFQWGFNKEGFLRVSDYSR